MINWGIPDPLEDTGGWRGLCTPGFLLFPLKAARAMLHASLRYGEPCSLPAIEADSGKLGYTCSYTDTGGRRGLCTLRSLLLPLKAARAKLHGSLRYGEPCSLPAIEAEQ